MHITNEVFAERDKKQNPQYTTQQRTDEYLHEGDCHLRIFNLQNVQSGERKDGSGYDNTRTSTDRLDDHIFS